MPRSNWRTPRLAAPISGRVGKLLVSVGNLVRANDTTPLVVINQVAPIYAVFGIPETQLPDLKRYMARGSLRVEAAPPTASGSPSVGRLAFVDNAVDQTTGTIAVRATFPNDDRRLWPGQFLNVTVTLDNDPAAIVVPTIAIQDSQQGKIVFVVKPDNTVEQRTIHIRRTRERGNRRRRRRETRRDGGDGRAASARARRSRDDSAVGSAREDVVNLSALFIERPVTTTLIMLGIVVFGVMAYRILPVSDLPNIDFPTDSGQRRTPRRQPRDDGVGGRVAAREAVRDDCRRDVDQFLQQSRLDVDHDSVRSQPQHRRRRAGRAGDDREDRAPAAAADAGAAVACRR